MRRLVASVLIPLSIAAALVAPASAAAGSSLGEGPHADAHVTAQGPLTFDVAEMLGDGARPAVGGGYNLHLPDGGVLHTHGADPDPRASGSAYSLTGVQQRAPVCATDKYQHVLYAYISGRSNRLSAVAPRITTILRQTNQLVNQASMESSQDETAADLKFKCTSGGQIQIDAIPTSSRNFADVVASARSRGFNLLNVDYTIFIDSPALSGVCGAGSIHRGTDGEKLAEDNFNNNPGIIPPRTRVENGYAVIWGGSTSGGADCWGLTTPLHEMAHTQGAVAVNAPHGTANNHCAIDKDMMCPSATGSVCRDFARFDCGYDDYFDAKVESTEPWLDTQWNLGSRFNHFMSFTDLPTSVHVAPAAVREDIGSARVTLIRKGEPAAFAVTFGTVSSTAVSPADFTSVSQRVQFLASEKTKTILVPIVNDSAIEPAEPFIARLSAPDGALLGTPQANVTIVGSDSQPDNWIRVGSGSWFGKNRYNTTGSGQTLLTSVRRGRIGTFYVTIQNDGKTTAAISVLRSRAPSGTQIIYRYGTGSVPSAFAIPPGAYRVIRVDFKMTASAAVGSIKEFTVRARWVGDSIRQDLVKGRVRVLS